MSGVWTRLVAGLACVALLQAQEEGKHCKLQTGQQGTCRKMIECPSAIHELDEYQRSPKICSFVDFTAIVCCDESRHTTEPSTTTTTTTTTTVAPTSAEPASYGKISKQKCREYSKWELDRFSTGPNGKPKMKAGRCGFGTATFVIGGTNASHMEFPHMVQLGFGDLEDITWECGGSLISDQFVLTAAHCMRKRNGVPMTYAKLGTGSEKTTQLSQIVRFIPHPSFNRVVSHYNDVALIQLDRKFQFNNYLRPACLQVETTFEAASVDIGIASGWGLTELGGQDNSETLQRVTLPFLEHEECSKTYRSHLGSLPTGLDEASQLCAGALNLGKDTCSGDSGGPLQIVLKKPWCMYSVVGVTSFGIRCGIAPGVYTRVSNYIPWIEGIVWPSGK